MPGADSYMSERGKSFAWVKLSELGHCREETGEGFQGDVYPGELELVS